MVQLEIKTLAYCDINRNIDYISTSRPKKKDTEDAPEKQTALRSLFL